MISIRPATLDDAPAMSAVLIASITELCGADHKNNPEALASWLANKTPAGIAQWFGNPAIRCSSPNARTTSLRSVPSMTAG